MSDSLDLLDYRRRVASMYSRVRRSDTEPDTWNRWTSDRDELFGTQPQSAIEDRSAFTGLDYFAYDPTWRLAGMFTAHDDEAEVLANSGEGTTAFRRVGTVRIRFDDQIQTLDVLWLDAYGGGLFLPFRDGTNGEATYAGGRYLIDTVKGADLGNDGDSLVLDFNYAYHPSCVHSPRWSCPLAPLANRIETPVRAGERLPK